MRRLIAVSILLTFCIAGAASLASAGLLGDIKSKLPIPDPEQKAKEEARKQLRLQIPDLDRILGEEPGLTTSFDDAVTGIPFFDDYEPAYTAPLCQLPTLPQGGFLISVPGDFEFEAASYCLHAGTHGPGSGEGYLYATLKGSQAGIITDILNNSTRHLDIPQQHIQSLVWGIQAKTKISDMPPELRDAASRLLSQSQISKLNGGALGMVPDELFDQAFFDVPAPLRTVMEAEARLRGNLTSGLFDFGALEQIAVLSGDPPDDDGGPVIPRGRWSFDPAGFFVRCDRTVSPSGSTNWAASSRLPTRSARASVWSTMTRSRPCNSSAMTGRRVTHSGSSASAGPTRTTPGRSSSPNSRIRDGLCSGRRLSGDGHARPVTAMMMPPAATSGRRRI